MHRDQWEVAAAALSTCVDRPMVPSAAAHEGQNISLPNDNSQAHQP